MRLTRGCRTFQIYDNPIMPFRRGHYTIYGHMQIYPELLAVDMQNLSYWIDLRLAFFLRSSLMTLTLKVKVKGYPKNGKF